MQRKKKEEILEQSQGSMITMVAFLLLIFGFTIASIFSKKRGFSENESRYLQQMPKFTMNALLDGSFAKEYETYLSDQFVGRDRWISIKSGSEKSLLKKDSNGVYFAKDDYLIEKHEASQINTEMAQKNVERLAEFLTRYENKLGAGHVYAMLVPTASEVLKDKLSKFSPDYDQDRWINELIQLSPAGTVVDVRDALKAEKEEYLYYRTDHHWSAYGAFYAYQEFAKQAGFEPLQLSDYKITLASDAFYGTTFSKVNLKLMADQIYLFESQIGNEYQVTYDRTKKSDSLFILDNLKKKDKYTVYLDGNHGLVEIKTKVSDQRKLLVIKDSYAHTFVPFLADHYEEIDMVDFRYFNMNISDYIGKNGITDILVLYNTTSFVQDKNNASFLK